MKLRIHFKTILKLWIARKTIVRLRSYQNTHMEFKIHQQLLVVEGRGARFSKIAQGLNEKMCLRRITTAEYDRVKLTNTKVFTLSSLVVKLECCFTIIQIF